VIFSSELRHNYFTLFANCKIVKGIARSIIYDLQLHTFDFITNDMYDLINCFSGKQIEACYKYYHQDNHEVINEYFTFLLENNYILLAATLEESKCFPELDLSYNIPSTISNAIIDLDDKSFATCGMLAYERLISDLESLQCFNIQIRAFSLQTLNDLDLFLQLFENRDFSIELILNSQQHWNADDYKNFYFKFSILQKMIIYDSYLQNTEVILADFPNISFTSEMMTDTNHCGNIHPSFFSVSLDVYLEALSFNSCLNKKVGIDATGEIKNCPSLNNSYGNIIAKSIKEVVFAEEFQSVGLIKKDLISVCNICEFRYMCTDCRAFVTNPYDKPFKCEYDPNTMTWNDVLL